MTRRCWCYRPVAKDVPGAWLCAEHDDPPPRNTTRERPLYLDIEEANRRDARNAGELASPPASTNRRAS